MKYNFTKQILNINCLCKFYYVQNSSSGPDGLDSPLMALNYIL